jgi:peptide-methionine (S)-S-oxide reductase
MFSTQQKGVMPTPEQALPGRGVKIALTHEHKVLGSPLQEPFPVGVEKVVFGLGCFWGAERRFWQQEGVFTTAVGYAAGFTPNPTYEEVCSGLTGHNEVVLVVFDPTKTSLATLLKVFWESHNPTQGMRQGNDRGTQYRSGIYTFTDEQKALAEATYVEYQAALENYYRSFTAYRILLCRGLPPTVPC